MTGGAAAGAAPRKSIAELWGLPTVALDEAKFLARDRFEPAVYAVRRDRWEIPILVRPGSDVGLCVFHGAKDRAKFQPPVFEGGGVASALGMTALLFSDPILARGPEPTIGWFAGFEGLPLQRILPGYIDHLSRTLGLRRRIMMGGSGGGFAALCYGLTAGADWVLTISPQTIVSRHNPRAVAAYFRAGFGVEEEAAVPPAVAARFCWDIRHLWPERLAERVSGRVVYLQNTDDMRHRTRHLQPLLDHLDTLGPAAREGFAVALRDWGPGHVAPPKPLVLEQLAEAAEALG